MRKITATATVDYLYDLAGHQIAEINSAGAWTREEVYVGGHHLATYSGGVTGTTYFDHADWLGTERGRSNVAGSICETIVSLPFGDGEATSGSCGDVSPMHYTGKQRDTETNLDDFDARYYSSQYGRFMSSDWSAVPVPVPYANLTNPQTLNLYALVNDNVVTFADLNGHAPLMSPGQSCVGTCNINGPGPSCTLDGIPITCAYVSGLYGAGAVVTENGIAITTDQRNGQSDPAKTEQSVSSAVNSCDADTLTCASTVTVKSKKSFWHRIKSWFSGGVGTIGAVARIPGRILRRGYERLHRTSWPTDPETGRNLDAHHVQAVADGGGNEPENIVPMTHQEHMELHRSNGDFARYGRRRWEESPFEQFEVESSPTQLELDLDVDVPLEIP